MSYQKELNEAISAAGIPMTKLAQIINVPYRRLKSYKLGDRTPDANAGQAVLDRIYAVINGQTDFSLVIKTYSGNVRISDGVNSMEIIDSEWIDPYIEYELYAGMEEAVKDASADFLKELKEEMPLLTGTVDDMYTELGNVYHEVFTNRIRPLIENMWENK